MISLPFYEIYVIFEIFEIKSQEYPVTDHKYNNSSKNKYDTFNCVLLQIFIKNILNRSKKNPTSKLNPSDSSNQKCP